MPTFPFDWRSDRTTRPRAATRGPVCPVSDIRNTTNTCSAVETERQRYAHRLAASRTRLVEAADTERRRIEHNLHDGAQQRLIALAFRLHEATLSLRRSLCLRSRPTPRSFRRRRRRLVEKSRRRC